GGGRGGVRWGGWEGGGGEGGGQVGHERTRGQAQQRGQGHRRIAGGGVAARRDPRPDLGGHDFRQDCQRFVRDLLGRGRRSTRDRGGARNEAGDRPLRDRDGGRRHERQRTRKGGAGEDEACADRLVRRSGHEGVGRQGQPAGGERAAQNEARDLIANDTQHTTEDEQARRRRENFRLSLLRARSPVVGFSRISLR